MEALSPREFKHWLKAYHNLNPGAAFPGLSLLVSDAGRTTYDIVLDAGARAIDGLQAPAVLDAGCGDGMLLALLGARVPDVRLFGADQSAGELDVARATLEPFGGELVAADLAALPFADSSFDLVLSHMVLSLLDDVPGAIAECARVLKSGASLVAVAGPIGPARGILEVARATAGELLAGEGKGLPPLDPRFASTQSIAAFDWDAVGFTGVRIQPIELSRRLTMEQLITFVGASYDALMLGKGGRELLEREVLEQAWKQADGDALVEVSSSVALCLATSRRIF